jgi:glycosyltransferase involved in cell wall biosynthesis
VKIAYVASGAGNMYCGSCIHDNTLAAALIKLGQQVALIPTYTPIRTDEDSVSIDQVFFGGVNVYLQQKSSLFRHTPKSIDQLLNNRQLLKYISRFTSSTDARELGPMTVSVLKGEEGNQKKELHKLTEWLKESYQPDLIHLTNAMFVGFARELKRVLQVPVLCSLQGEDIFLEQLLEPYRTTALEILRERARDVDSFIATSQYYAGFMADYLQLPISRIDVVQLGLNLRGHGEAQAHKPDAPFVIGYLARICPEKGLHQLVEAFNVLVERGLNTVLRAAGYLGNHDREYFKDLQNKISNYGWKDRFEYIGEIDRMQKIKFLNGLHVLSVPTVYREPKGLYVFEALANEVPVVQPAHGAFPEWIEATGGGLLVAPGSATALADGIQSLYRNPELRKDLGRRGKEAVHRNFSDLDMAKNTLRLYQKRFATATASQQN